MQGSPGTVRRRGDDRATGGIMADGVKIAAWGVLALVFAMAANWGTDQAYQAHALILMLIAAVLFVRSIGMAGTPAPVPETGYMDGVIRAGVIATAFWGVIGFPPAPSSPSSSPSPS